MVDLTISRQLVNSWLRRYLQVVPCGSSTRGLHMIARIAFSTIARAAGRMGHTGQLPLVQVRKQMRTGQINDYSRNEQFSLVRFSSCIIPAHSPKATRNRSSLKHHTTIPSIRCSRTGTLFSGTTQPYTHNQCRQSDTKTQSVHKIFRKQTNRNTSPPTSNRAGGRIPLPPPPSPCTCGRKKQNLVC